MWCRRLCPRWLVLSSLLLLVAACGVGSVEEDSFVFGVMGPEGGVIDTGGLHLVIPAGALAGPTNVSVLPETTPYPILAPANDPCTYQILGSQWCCGPRGLPLLVNGSLVVHYDPALLPPGVTEDDLVLLLWDEATLSLVPDPNAIVDGTSNTIFLSQLPLLGHLAVGYRTCQVVTTRFVFTGVLATGSHALRTGLAPVGQEGLYQATVDGSEAPVLLSTPSLPPVFQPSPDGTRVLFEGEGIVGGADFPSLQLYTVAAGDTDPLLVAGENEDLVSYDPLHGWMRDGQRVFFQEFILGGQSAGVSSDPDRTVFGTVPGDQVATPTELYEIGAYPYVYDVRQSPDGSMVLIVYFDQSESTYVDVFDAVTGDPISQGVIPVGGGQSTPRWLPDSSGVYVIDEETQAEVDRYDPDGSNPGVLFDLPPGQGSLKDFALAPNGDDYAYIADLVLAVEAGPDAAVIGQQGGGDGLYVGSLSGGPRGVQDLGTSTYYDELVFHPDGQNVFLSSYDLGCEIFGASDATPGPVLPVNGISQVDVNSLDGRLLLVTGPYLGRGDATLPTAQTAPGGLYVADSDGSNQTPVNLPSDLQVVDARWLHSTRTAPCMGYVNLVR